MRFFEKAVQAGIIIKNLSRFMKTIKSQPSSFLLSNKKSQGK